MTERSPSKQNLPIPITTELPTPARLRSPRMTTWCWMIVLPPSMMFCEPEIKAFLDTLLPVSYIIAKGHRFQQPMATKAGYV